MKPKMYTVVDSWYGTLREYKKLSDKDTPFMLMLPKECYLSIFIGKNKFVQIQVEKYPFNHYSAIMEMERLGLIN